MCVIFGGIAEFPTPFIWEGTGAILAVSRHD
jgi:hypothetical protein